MKMFTEHASRSFQNFFHLDGEMGLFRTLRNTFVALDYLSLHILTITQANRLCEVFLSSSKDGKPVNMSLGLRAAVVDISLDFVFDHTPDYLRGIQDENFDTVFVRTTLEIMDWTNWLARNFPRTVDFAIKVLPHSILKAILPGTATDIEHSEVSIIRILSP
jgi:hypothetical protein